MNPIVIDVQHMGKPWKPADRGAVFNEFVESDLCLTYGSILHCVLSKAGIPAFLVTYNDYESRAKFANKVNASLYLACHLNSSLVVPKVNYSLIEISTKAGDRTKRYADILARNFSDKLPVGDSKVITIGLGDRGYQCISHVIAPALLLEPCFINHPDSQELLSEGIYLISNAIFQMIKECL